MTKIFKNLYRWWYYKDLINNPAFNINNFISENLSNISSLRVWQQVIIKKVNQIFILFKALFLNKLAS
jgi:ssDNA-specific exonuclease RecJ